MAQQQRRTLSAETEYEKPLSPGLSIYDKALALLNETFSVKRLASGDPEVSVRASKKMLEMPPSEGVSILQWRERILKPHLPSFILQRLDDRKMTAAQAGESQAVRFALSKWVADLRGKQALNEGIERTKAEEREKKPVEAQAIVAYDVYSNKSQDGTCKDVDRFMAERAISPKETGVIIETRIVGAPREFCHPPAIDSILAKMQTVPVMQAMPATQPAAGAVPFPPSASTQVSLPPPPMPMPVVATVATDKVAKKKEEDKQAAVVEDEQPVWRGDPYSPSRPKSAAEIAVGLALFGPPPYTQHTVMSQELMGDEFEFLAEGPVSAVLADSNTEQQQQAASDTKAASQPPTDDAVRQPMEFDITDTAAAAAEKKQNGHADAKEIDDAEFQDPMAVIKNLMAKASTVKDDKDVIEVEGGDDDDEQEGEEEKATPAVRRRKKRENELAQQDAGITEDDERAFLAAFSALERKKTLGIENPVERQKVLSEESKKFRKQSKSLRKAAKDDFARNALVESVFSEAKKEGIVAYDNSSDAEDSDFEAGADEEDEDEDNDDDEEASEDSSDDASLASEESKKKRKKSTSASRKKLDSAAKDVMPALDRVREAAASTATPKKKLKKQKKTTTAAAAAASVSANDATDFAGLTAVIRLMVEHFLLRAPRSTLSRVAAGGVRAADLPSDADRKARDLFWRYGFSKADKAAESHMLFRACNTFMKRVQDIGTNAALIRVLEMLCERKSQIDAIQESNAHCVFTHRPGADWRVRINGQLDLPVVTHMKELLLAFHFGTHFDLYVQKSLEVLFPNYATTPANETAKLIDQFCTNHVSEQLAQRWIDAKKMFD